MGLTIASRKSDLARIQAYMVGEALSKKNPTLKIDYQFSASLGDINQQDPLWKMPSQGVFTQDFREHLIKGDVDMVVHSWKDLPIDNEGPTVLAASLPRADHRDMILIKKSAIEKIKKTRTLKLLTSSPRRIYNLTSFLTHAFPLGLEKVEFEDVRGNIQTRLNKLMVHEGDGLVVAKAAIDRLLLSDQWRDLDNGFAGSAKNVADVIAQCEWMILPTSHNPPAAAQGALVVEVAANRFDLIEMLQTINCAQTFQDVTRERQILKSHGGGCHQKIGVWVNTQKFGEVTSLRGQTDAGTVLNSYTLKTDKDLAPIAPNDKACTPPKSTDFFDRHPISITQESQRKIKQANALLIATSSVPDEYFAPITDQVIWTSGVKSWFAFAKKGIWVHGSDDNLGAYSQRNVEALMGRAANWLSLTHKDSPSNPKIGTYELSPHNSNIVCDGATHFYWRSGSIFKRALQLNPEIFNGVHACGIGRTYEIVSEILGEGGKLYPCLSEQDWRKKLGLPD